MKSLTVWRIFDVDSHHRHHLSTLQSHVRSEASLSSLPQSNIHVQGKNGRPSYKRKTYSCFFWTYNSDSDLVQVNKPNCGSTKVMSTFWLPYLIFLQMIQAPPLPCLVSTCPVSSLSPVLAVNLREAKNLKNWHTQTISKNVWKVKANFLWLVLNIFIFSFDCNYARGSALNIMRREFKILLWTKFNTPVSKVKSLVTTFSIISLLSLG